jgi:hypothetical protein
MKGRALVAAIAIAASLVPATASAWGFAGHRFIMARAIELLPQELKPFFDHYRDEIVVRAVDPDLWRNVGWEDDPNHFMDFGVREYGDYPFTALPRDYDKALEKFGMATIRGNGTLPWRVQEMFGSLRRAFEGFERGSLYGPSDVVLFSAVLGHYIQDAHQPLHATNNHDGQLTGNNGIHARFERDLVEKFQSRLHIKPAEPAAITNPRDFAFDTLLASNQLLNGIIKADSDAVRGKDEYDADYFEKFMAGAQPVLEKRLADAITATAALIIGAWEAAGSPALTLEGARPVEKVRKPGNNE